MPHRKPKPRGLSGRVGQRRRAGTTRPSERAHSYEAVQAPSPAADALLESSPLGILMVDRAGRIVRANGRLEAMFGFARDELAGVSLETLLPERFRASHGRHRTAFFGSPEIRPMGLGLDLTARRKDGSEFPVEISLSFIGADDGLHGLAFVIDVTARRNAQRQLQAEFLVTRAFADQGDNAQLTPHLLRTLCENLDWDLGEFWRVDGDVLRYDSGWHHQELNTQEFDAVGREITLSRGTGLAGRAWQEERAVWMREGFFARSRADAAARLGLQSGCAFPIRSDRAMTGVMLLLSRNPRGPDDALLAMLTDIGSRIGQHVHHRRVQTELSRQREVLYQSEKLAALGRLVAGVAHEMNNPLGIISSRIELMLAEADGQAFPAQHLEDLKVVHRNVLRVAGVAQALRSFARQSSGERRSVDLNAVVGETLLLAGKPMSTDNVRIVTALDPALPALLGNANALQQVLLNLLTNAREAMTQGGEVRIETGPDPERPGRLRLVVADTGPGIPATDLPHLFEPFYTTKPAGTGLGLAVSYGIVQDHLGSIDVQSAPGQGARFTISFPILEGLAGPA